VAPSPLVATLGSPVERGKVRTVEQLRVLELEHAWALGDCAHVPNAAEDGRPCPPTAQHALRQARRTGLNVAASLGYGAPKPFRHPNRGSVATLGVGDGVAQLGPIALRGRIAWFAARTYHLLALPTSSRRVRVAIDWTMQLLLPSEVVQLGQLGHPPRLDDTSLSAGTGQHALVRPDSSGSRTA
jgi:NADH dehydrogenase